MHCGGLPSQKPREEDAELQAHLRADESSRRRYKTALQRFLRVSAQRKRHFQALKRQENENRDTEKRGDNRKHESPSSPPPPSSRMFILSDSDEPWSVFVPVTATLSSFQRKLRVKRLVFEWSDLHVSSLHAACGSGNRALVRKLLGCSTLAPPPCCSLVRDASGRILLHHAVIREQHKVVKVLLRRADARLQAHVRDNAGYIAAHYALLKLGALAHRRYPRESRAASRAARCMKRVSKRYRRLWRIADLLVSLVHPELLNSASNGDGNDNQDYYNLKALDLRCRGDEWDATRNGDLERLQFLVNVYRRSHPTSSLRDSGRLPMVLSELRRSLLHEACDRQQLQIVCYLVTQGLVSRSLQDVSGCSALHYAAMRGFLEGCVMLLNEQCGGDGYDDGGDVEAQCLSIDARGRTPLHWSLLSSSIPPAMRSSIAEYLVRRCASALHVQDCDGLTPLHLAISRGDLEIVQLFVTLGANVNASSYQDGGIEIDLKSWKATASWAPCGTRFHGQHRKPRDHRLKSPNQEGDGGEQTNQREEKGAVCESTLGIGEGGEARERVDGVSESIADSKSPDPNPQDYSACGLSAGENSVVMDTLWYWVRTRKKKEGSKAKGSVVGSEIVPAKPQSLGETVPSVPGEATATDEEEEGESSARACRKYGSVCRKCAVTHPDATKLQDPAAAILSVPMSASSPLVLAIRACKRRSSLHQDRVGIVELLLLSGADPNGNGSDGDNDDNVGNGQVALTKPAASPLLEALSVALECPQILPLLLRHGAKRLSCATQLKRFCRTMSAMTSTAAAATLDAALLSVSDILFAQVFQREDRHSSVLLVSAFFVARCFNLLTRLLQLRRRHHSSSRGQDQDPTGVLLQPPLGLWEAIETGLSQKQNKSRSLGRQALDREHLWFLCERLKRSQLEESRPESRHNQEGEALRRLLRFCVDCCLAQWRLRAQLALMDEREHAERQRMVLTCLELVMLSLGEARREAKDTGPGAEDREHFSVEPWLDDCIALGFFDCALALTDSQRSRGQSISMDRLLQVYDDQALLNRHHLAGFPSHKAFLTALVERCAAHPDPDADADPEPRVPMAASMESVVRVCAYDLPLDLVQKILGLCALLDRADDGSITASWTSFRVGGKTLCEWLVRHQRRDLIRYLLEHDALAHERIVLWRDCVSTAAISPMGEPKKRELLRWLLSLYPPKPSGDAGGEEERKLIKWLVQNRAVRCDSPLLFVTIIEPFWSKRLASTQAADAMTLANREGEKGPSQQHQARCTSDATSLTSALLAMGVCHEIARWNALQLATYLVEELFAKALPAGEPHIKWQASLIGQRGTDEQNDPSPLEICNALGHAELAQLFLRYAAKPSEVCTESSSVSQDHLLPPPHGLFATVMRLNAQAPEPQAPLVARYRKAMLVKPDERLGVFQSGDPWQTACRFNLVTHLEALKVHQFPVLQADDSRLPLPPGLPGLLQLTIESGSLDALRWLLNHHNNRNSLKEPEIQALYDAASRHSSDLYARMTLLLLEHLPYSGRLAGEGADVTLLHRCVCFSNALLMQQAVNRVLLIPGSSVNVLDAFGNAPVVYAAISGNLVSLCFLVRIKCARLEAEFEGQTSFYYSLQLLPSFPWRWVLKKLLVEQCQRRFLHCSRDADGDDEAEDASAALCGCKGFESVVAEAETVEEAQDGECEGPSAANGEGENEPLKSPDGDAGGDSVCGFCGHGAERHTKVPFPPWFMDQYETYLGVSAASHGSDGSDSESDDGQNCGSDQERRGEGASDENALEEQRGRLSAAALTVIAIDKYANVIKEYGLSIAPGLDEAHPRTECSESPEATGMSNGNDASTTSIPSLPFENWDPGATAWMMFPLQCLDQVDEKRQPQQGRINAMTVEDRNANLGETPGALGEQDPEPSCGKDDDEVTVDLIHLPWRLRNELQAIHPQSCHCHDHALFVTASMWMYEIVSQWLWVCGSRYCSPTPCQQQQPANLPPPTPPRRLIPLHIVRSSKWTLQLAFSRWRNNTHASPPPLESRLSALNPRRRRKLQQFLSHWRFANAFVAFQHWKHSRESRTGHHMQLESLLEEMVAQMRGARLEALRERQKQLHKGIAQGVDNGGSGGVVGDWEYRL